MATLDWLDDSAFTFEGETFTSVGDPTDARPDPTGTPSLSLVKEPELLDSWASFFAPFQGARIVELGIYQGGSTALLALLTDPEHLLAVDLSPDPLPALDEFLARHDLADRVTTRFGLDQSDATALEAALRDAMGDEPLDIVVDDASHLYGPTIASFETLFPKLRPGGWYLIEDWNSADRFYSAGSDLLDGGLDADLAVTIRAGLEELRRQVPLHRMALELTLARCSMDEAIGRVTLTPWWIMVERGNGAIDGRLRFEDLVRDNFDQLRDAQPGGTEPS
jgi:hypothetical protein